MSFNQALQENTNYVKYDVIFGNVIADSINVPNQPIEADTIKADNVLRYTNTAGEGINIENVITVNDTGISFQADDLNPNKSSINTALYTTGAIAWRQSGDLARVIFETPYSISKIGKLVILDVGVDGGTINNLQGGNYLAGNLALPADLQPVSDKQFNCSLVADNENQFNHPSHRFQYDKGGNDFYLRNATSNAGQWDNARTFNFYGNSFCWITN